MNYKSTVFWSLLCSLMLYSCGTIRSSVILQKATVQESGESESSFKYDDSFSLILITVTINRQSWRMVFDTGANATIVSKEMAVAIGLREKARIKVRDAHQEMRKLSVGVIDSLKIDRISYTDIGVLVNDFKENPQFSCLGIDGILGTNILKSNNWKINYSDRTVVVTDIDSPITLSIDAKSIPIHQNSQGLPSIDLYVNGVKENFILDTGYNSELLSVSSTLDLEPTSFALGYSSFGLFGGGSIDTSIHAAVDISDSGAFNLTKVSVSQSKNLESLAGTGFFNKYTRWIAFDFKRSLLYWEPSEEANNQIISYGFTPMLRERSIVVGEKELGYSPEIDEINLGDTIVGVNDIAYTGDNSCQILNEIWHSRFTRKPIDLRISRNDHLYRFVLQSKDTVR